MGGGCLLSSPYKTWIHVCTRTNEAVWHDGKSGLQMPEYLHLQNEVTIALEIGCYNVCQMQTYSA